MDCTISATSGNNATANTPKVAQVVIAQAEHPCPGCTAGKCGGKGCKCAEQNQDQVAAHSREAQG